MTDKYLLGTDWSARRVVLAGGDGHEFHVVGESNYQDTLEALACGKGEDGCNINVAVQLFLEDDNLHDPQAVVALIDCMPVGYVPRALCAEVRREICALVSGRGPVFCAGKIVGGWENEFSEGSFGVKLYLKRPLSVLDD